MVRIEPNCISHLPALAMLVGSQGIESHRVKGCHNNYQFCCYAPKGRPDEKTSFTLGFLISYQRLRK